MINGNLLVDLYKYAHAQHDKFNLMELNESNS